jgi:predicted MFS family arabinose efflux permease
MDQAAAGRARANQAIRRIAAAETISGFGTQLSWLALPWFVLATTGSATRMAAVFAAELLPVALLGLPSALLAARLGTKITMRGADLFRALLVALVPVLHRAGVLDFPVLLLLVCAIGAFAAPYLACQRSVLAEILPDEAAMIRANGLVEGGTRLAAFAGPAAAGTLIAAIGTVNVLWFDATSYVLSFLLLSILPGRRRAASGVNDVGGVFGGIRQLLGDPLLARLGGASIIYGFLFPVVLASLPVLTYTRYGGRPSVVGALFASWGAGSVVGSMLAIRLARRIPPLRLGGYAAVAAALPLWLLSLHVPAVVAGGLMVASGICVPVLNTCYLTVITLRPTEAMRTQVLTVLATGNLLAGAVGYLCAGFLLQAAGTAPVFALAAAAATGCAVVLVRTKSVPSPLTTRPEASRGR